MYSLGFPAQYHNDDECELWARHLKYEASELFDLVSALVGTWAKDLVRKAMGKQPPAGGGGQQSQRAGRS